MPIDKINLEQLKSIDFTKTALEDIQQEIIDYISNHPTFSTKWDNFYDSDTGRIITDVFAFLMRKLMVRIDLIANENFPSTAQQDTSIVKVLKLIGYELRSYTQAEVFLNVTYPQGRPQSEIVIGNEYGITTSDLQGNDVTFYVRKSPYNYFESVIIGEDIDGKAKTGLILKAYSGELVIENVDRDGIITKDSEIYILGQTPVTQDSIRITYTDVFGVSQEALQTDSFFNVPSTQTIVPFIVRYDEFNGAYIEFGDRDLVPVLPDNNDIQIYYLVGGGSTHNIIENSINVSETFVANNNAPVLLNINNPGKGYGGKDPETIQEAKTTAPLSLKTINRAVTESDYAILLQQQGIVRYSQILSPNDNRDYFPSDSQIPLFHVWIYITVNKPIESMENLLITKQVDNVGELIGGDAYDIVNYLSERRIIGIENVLTPSKYTRLFFEIDVEYNQFVDTNSISEGIREQIEALYDIANTMYWRKVRLVDLISRVRQNVQGVLDIRIRRFRIKNYEQILDVVSSPYYFRYLNDNPEFIVNNDSVTNLPTDYSPTFDEVCFVLDRDTDVGINFFITGEF